MDYSKAQYLKRKLGSSAIESLQVYVILRMTDWEI